MNKSKPAAALMAAAFLPLASAGVCADDNVVSTTWSTGMEYSSGTYGGDTDIEDFYVPVTLGLNFERVSLDLTVPYLSVRAPEGTIVTDPGGDPVPGSGDTVTESGLGDVIAGITVYDVMYSHDLGLALDLTGKIKFGTADEDKGLGTGEQDFTVRADLYKFLEQFTLLGSLGYKFRGDTETVPVDDVVIGSIGGIYHLSDRKSLGLLLDYREAAYEDGDDVTELSAFLSQELNDSWSLQLYIFTGFTDSSSDWGGGILLSIS